MPCGERLHELFAQARDDLVGKGDEVAAVALELVEQADAVERVAAGEAATKRSTVSTVGEAEQVAHRVGVDLLDAARDDLVEHRLGVAHATGGALGDQVDRFVADDAPFGLSDAPQLAANLRLRQWPEGEALQTARPRPAGCPTDRSCRR